MFALGKEISALAVVGSIFWAFRRLKKPRSRWATDTRFIAYAPNFPLFSCQQVALYSFVGEERSVQTQRANLSITVRLYWEYGVVILCGVF